MTELSTKNPVAASTSAEKSTQARVGIPKRRRKHIVGRLNNVNTWSNELLLPLAVTAEGFIPCDIAKSKAINEAMSKDCGDQHSFKVPLGKLFVSIP